MASGWQTQVLKNAINQLGVAAPPKNTPEPAEQSAPPPSLPEEEENMAGDSFSGSRGGTGQDNPSSHNISVKNISLLIGENGRNARPEFFPPGSADNGQHVIETSAVMDSSPLLGTAAGRSFSKSAVKEDISAVIDRVQVACANVDSTGTDVLPEEESPEKESSAVESTTGTTGSLDQSTVQQFPLVLSSSQERRQLDPQPVNTLPVPTRSGFSCFPITTGHAYSTYFLSICSLNKN